MSSHGGVSIRIGPLLIALAACLAPAETGPLANPQDAEVSGVQRHLMGAEALLADGDTRRLSRAQRLARVVQAQRLAAYRAAGRFPHNYEIPGRRAPCFVDAHGTQCAMAYLIAQSGRTDIVELVARTKNYATVY